MLASLMGARIHESTEQSRHKDAGSRHDGLAELAATFARNGANPNVQAMGPPWGLAHGRACACLSACRRLIVRGSPNLSLSLSLSLSLVNLALRSLPDHPVMEIVPNKARARARSLSQ